MQLLPSYHLPRRQTIRSISENRYVARRRGRLGDSDLRQGSQTKPYSFLESSILLWIAVYHLYYHVEVAAARQIQAVSAWKLQPSNIWKYKYNYSSSRQCKWNKNNGSRIRSEKSCTRRRMKISIQRCFAQAWRWSTASGHLSWPQQRQEISPYSKPFGGS